MATYAIGDIQGCFETFQALLERFRFDKDRDRLWLVGDLVNRGPRSLDVLRYLMDLGPAAVTVLGNHDLHLIARYAGVDRDKPGDTLSEILTAPDAEILIEWLASRPLAFREQGHLLVHAGLLPEWSIADAERHAADLASRLRDPAQRVAMLKESPKALKALVTIRTCHQDGSLCKHAGPPQEAPDGCVPWFAAPGRRSHGTTIIFGHWSALGFQNGHDYVGLDSGCVWGQSLTAWRLEDAQVFSEKAREAPLGEP